MDKQNLKQNAGQKGPLLKLLVNAGLGSRRNVAGLLKQKRVCVNGNIVDNFNFPVNLRADTIAIDGKPFPITPAPRIVLMLNKPAGILSTTSDERGRTTIISILPEKYQEMNLYPAGRLDKNSTGLLLLTNDGELTYKLTHPKFEHEKEYLVFIKDKLTTQEKVILEKGIQLDDGLTHPAVIKELKNYQPFNYSIIIHEGRKRQVRRMFEKTGHHIIALKRIRIGKLNLGRLEEGKVRELTTNEIEQLLLNKMD